MENAVEKIYCCGDNNNTVPAWTLWGNNNLCYNLKILKRIILSLF